MSPGAPPAQSLPESELHPALTRLRRRLELCQAPLVRLWGWPASGRRLLLRNLSAFHPQRWVQLPRSGRLIHHLEAAPTSAPHLWLDRCPDQEELEAAVEALTTGQRLYFPSSSRLGLDAHVHVPVHVHGAEVDGPFARLLSEELLMPREWLLTAGEVAASTPDPFDDAGTSDLMLSTAGWWGPLRWRRRRLASAQDGSFGSPEFAHWLSEKVLDAITPRTLAVLDGMRLTGCFDMDLWRLACADSPQHLQTLEQMIHFEGWSTAPWPELWVLAPWHLPPTVEPFGPSDVAARRRWLHRRLGLAAHWLGRPSLAQEHLKQSDQPLWAEEAASLTSSSGRLAVRSLDLSEGHDVPPPGDVQRRFEITLLGLPEVVEIGPSGRRQVPWKLRRALSTLAFLALAPGRRASREELENAIWKDIEPRAIRKNFHPTLSTLRRALDVDRGGQEDPALRFQQGIYQLSPHFDWEVDVDRFEALQRQGFRLLDDAASSPAAEHQALEVLEKAWRLYRGPLLSEFEDAWLSSRRHELRRKYVQLLSRLGDLLVRVGRPQQAIDVHRMLLLEEPFTEGAHLTLMELYAQQGRRDLVRRQYVRLQDLLRQELGVEPMEATQARYHELMR